MESSRIETQALRPLGKPDRRGGASTPMRAVSVAILCCLWSSASLAQSNWKLDSFSYLQVPSAGIAYQMRPSELPLQITPSGTGRWAMRLPKGLLGVRTVRSAALQVSITAVDDGVGELVLEG